MDSDIIKKSFIEKYNKEPEIFRSPGRINLIGEHTDYNEGFVLPAAIDKEMIAAIAPNGTEGTCRAFAYDLNEDYQFSLNEMKAVDLGWPNYIMGVADQILKNGGTLSGFDIVIGGDVPLGSGLSSSAALECAVAFALDNINDLGFSKVDMVKMSQMAEHTYAGVKCGIMDQFASMMGKKDHVFRLDCKTLEFEYYPLELKEYQILLINTNVKHSLVATEYNARRQECEKGVAILKKSYPEINSLRDVSLDAIQKHKNEFEELTFKRCTYVIKENDRVLKSCDALQKGDLKLFGQMVYASHDGLSNDYEVSCPELDYLVDQTMDKSYVLGSRMMGGGFGGCTLNIIEKKKVKEFIELVGPLYKEKFGKEMTPISVFIEDGTSVA